MANWLETIANVLPYLERAPIATEWALHVNRARNGDLESIAYLANGGWADVLDVHKPGLGDHARIAVKETGDAWDKVYREARGLPPRIAPVREPPWAQFKRWIIKQKSGPFVIVGRTGSGKTELAKKIAVTIALKQNYPIEFCNFYPDDMPPSRLDDGSELDLRIIDLPVLLKRTERVQKIMRHGIRPEDAAEPKPITKKASALVLPVDYSEPEPSPDVIAELNALPFRRRVIVIDEAGLEDFATNTRAKNAVIRALAESRHLEWLVILIAQQFIMMSRPVIAQSVIFVKNPTGREPDSDRQSPYVRQIWRNALEEFRDVRDYREWSEYPDLRAWSYVEAPSAPGLIDGYLGLFPAGMIVSK